MKKDTKYLLGGVAALYLLKNRNSNDTAQQMRTPDGGCQCAECGGK